ncbi:MAG TPA: 3-hydroxyacyl-ACP dehydratase FabZ [Polyangia bacterium]|nr:3-hydroxyacyl-ACP dehydratase FabZ [Polyangia bacterium]
MDIRDIEKILPHRYPFLLVDRVEEISDDHIVALKQVTRNEPHFQGHFPGHPVMPGVLIIEALAQAGAIYAARLVGFDPDKQVIYFMAIEKAKFRRPVIPGDSLRLRVTPLRKGGAIWKLRGEATVGDALVAEAEFLASIQPRQAPPKTGGGGASAAGGDASGG